jgi:hypothetical protein
MGEILIKIRYASTLRMKTQRPRGPEQETMLCPEENQSDRERRKYGAGGLQH